MNTLAQNQKVVKGLSIAAIVISALAIIFSLAMVFTASATLAYVSETIEEYSSLGSYFHPELHFRENRSSPAKSLLEFSAWREVRQKVRQISTVFKTGHLQEKNRRAPTNADALR